MPVVSSRSSSDPRVSHRIASRIAPARLHDHTLLHLDISSLERALPGGDRYGCSSASTRTSWRCATPSGRSATTGSTSTAVAGREGKPADPATWSAAGRPRRARHAPVDDDELGHRPRRGVDRLRGARRPPRVRAGAVVHPRGAARRRAPRAATCVSPASRSAAGRPGPCVVEHAERVPTRSCVLRADGVELCAASRADRVLRRATPLDPLTPVAVFGRRCPRGRVVGDRRCRRAAAAHRRQS